MSRVRTLDELSGIVRQRTNMENSEFITDGEIKDNINEEWAELYGRVSLAENQPHYVNTTTIAVSQPTTLYALPADFWKVLNVSCTVDNVTRDMDPFMEGERAELHNGQFFTLGYPVAARYRVQGDNIEILPVSRSFTVNLRYVRACPVLIDGSDTLDGINGYEAVVIAGACALVREKEESDPSFFERRKERLWRAIDALAAQRDASRPERVLDVVGLYVSDREWIP